ncbi:MAG: FtsX-like permease family protein [Rhizobacter sp.]|nr:FtsX-like permease family protein [Chlorobiales bacterium]
MAFLKIFAQVSLRHVALEKGKFILSVSGVAIGVAVFLAIRLSNYSALKAFEAATDNVNGKANMQIQSRSGTEFRQDIFKQVLGAKDRIPALQAATPVIEQLTQLKRNSSGDSSSTGETLIVLGIDIFTDRAFRTYQDADGFAGDAFLQFLLQPNTIIFSEAYAKRNGVKKNDTVKLIGGGITRELKVIGIFKSDAPGEEVANSFAVMDIEQAQRTFGKTGRLDKIDLLVDQKSFQNLQDYFAANLPEDVEAVSAKNRGEQIGKMLAAFDLNLSALSFISLLVAMFLIYNTITTNALRRRRETGILRSLGLSQAGVFGLFIAEALLIGIAGSAIGVGLGIVLAKYTLAKIAQTITTLYIYVAAEQVFVSASLVGIAAALGVGSSLASAILPAWEAAKVHPRETFFLQTFEKKFTASKSKIFITSVAMLAAGYGFTLLPGINGFPVFGFAAALAVIIGFAFIAPEVVLLCRDIFDRTVGKLFGIEGTLANNYLVEALNRTSTAVSALMVAVAMLIGISVMVGSFRSTVVYWVDQTLKADVFIAPAQRFAVGSQPPLSPEVYEYVRAIPETESVDAFSSRSIVYDGALALLTSANLDAVLKSSRLMFRQGDARQILSEAIADSTAICVTEVFANKFGVKEASLVRLQTPSGTRVFRVVGVYFDYTSDRGLIMIHRAHFEKIWQDTKVSNLGVYLKDKSQTDRIVKEVREKFKDTASILVYSNLSLRRNVLDIFDQTFAITYALQFIAMVVAAMGVISSLSAIIFERKREIGVLRSVGASAAQVRNMTLIEAFLMGVIASVLGVVCGFFLSLILIYVINLQSFGWTIQLHLPIETFIGAAVLVIFTALIAGWIPARYASRLLIAEEVRFE